MKSEDAILARLAALEGRGAVLEERMSALEAGNGKPPWRAPPARVDEGVTLTYPNPPASSFVMPSISELHKLLAIVQEKCPQLAPDFCEEVAFFSGFARAFFYIGQLGRTDELNKKVSIGWWVDACSDFLRRSNMEDHMIGAYLAAAVLAHGDIAYSPKNPDGRVWEFGLKPHGGLRKTGWRTLLATGELRNPYYVNRIPAQQVVDITFAA
jgi:hypothetical protein